MWFRERKKKYFRTEIPYPGIDEAQPSAMAFSHPQPPSPLHPSVPGAEVKDWWSWRRSGNLANRTVPLRPLPWLPAQLLLLSLTTAASSQPPEERNSLPQLHRAGDHLAASSQGEHLHHYRSLPGTCRINLKLGGGHKKKHPGWDRTH